MLSEHALPGCNMIKKEEVYKIGFLNKPYGVRGELLFTFTDDVFDRVEAEYILCLLDGIFVPFFLEEYRFRSDSTALVKFDGVDTAEKARMFTNVEVYFPLKLADKVETEELSLDYFVGFRVIDVHCGDLGEITEVDDTTMNTLFIIEHNAEELLIPAREEFIVKIDRKKKRMTVDLPHGLLHLEEAIEGDND